MNSKTDMRRFNKVSWKKVATHFCLAGIVCISLEGCSVHRGEKNIPEYDKDNPQSQSEKTHKPTVPWKALPPPKYDENVPEYDADNPKSNGIFLSFHHWPLSTEQRDIILQITRQEKFTFKDKFHRLKSWMFLWDEWYPAIKAKKACNKFKKLSFLEGCSINKVLKPL